MSGVDVLIEALRPLVAELVEQEVERQLDAIGRPRNDEPYLTTDEYARLHKTTTEAVAARCRRGTLPAFKPPGSREWLIAVDEGRYDAQQ